MTNKTWAGNQFLCVNEHKMPPAEFSAARVNSEIRGMVINTIGGIRGGGSVKSRLRSAARLLGLSVSRVREYHYNRVRRIEAHEAFQIIQRAQQAKRDQFTRMQHEYEALRLELANSAPSRLGFLVPPSVAPLPDLAGAAEVGSRARRSDD